LDSLATDATMLGYTHQQTARLPADVGSDWKHHAPDDHTR
jgi:hypothetical protein